MRDKHIWDEVNKNLNGEITHKDEVYKKIQKEYFPKDKKDKRLRFWILIPVLSIIVVTLSVSIYFIAENNKPSIEYADDKKIKVQSSIAEINSSSNYFQFNFDGTDTLTIYRYYDSASGDTLHYSLKFAYNNAEIGIEFITNINYDYKFDEPLFNHNKIAMGLPFQYNKKYEEYFLTIKSFSEKQGQKILITYQELSEDGSEDTFWNFIESFIIVK